MSKKNIKIAKNLIKIAKQLVGLNEFENFSDNRSLNTINMQADEFCDILKVFLLKSKENAKNNQQLSNAINKFKLNIGDNAQQNIEKLNVDLDKLEEKTQEHRFFMNLYAKFKKESKKFDLLAMMWRLNRIFQMFKQRQENKSIKIDEQDEELFNKVIKLLQELKMKAYIKDSKQQGDINTENLLSISSQLGESRLRIKELMKKLNNENKNVKMVIASVEENNSTIVHAMNIISTINRDKTILDMREKLIDATDQEIITKGVPKEPSQNELKKINQKLKETYGIQDEKNNDWTEITNNRNASFIGDFFKEMIKKISFVFSKIISVFNDIYSSCLNVQASIEELPVNKSQITINDEYQMICKQMIKIAKELENMK